MSYAAERAAIESRLVTGWATTPIAFENVEYNPTPGTSYVYCRIENDSAYQVELRITNALFRHYGRIVLSIFYPYGRGLGIAQSYAATLGAIFRGKQFSGIVCKSAYISGMERAGEWYRLDLTIPFHRDSLLAVVGTVVPAPGPMDMHFDTTTDRHIGVAGDEHIDV